MIKFPKPKRIILNLRSLFCILIFTFCIGDTLYAAELKLISPYSSPFGLGQEFRVDLMLDPQDKEINAVSAILSFPKELVELVGVDDGSSILTLWIERPVLGEEKISFAGIVPGGFIGILGPSKEVRPGKVLEITLRTKRPGQGEVVIEEAEVLLHDGLGTSAEFQVSNFKFQISEDIELIPVKPIPDTIPPEPFTPEVVKHPQLFDDKYFLVFSTIDKQSGIGYYEVKEGKRGWEKAESPHILKDQNLRSYIYVKAVDRAGNEIIEVVGPRYPIGWHENWWIFVIIIVTGLVVIYVIRKFLWRR